METATGEKREVTAKEEKSKKRKWLSRFTNFLMYGGWLLMIIVIVGIMILVSVLFN